MAAMNTDQVRKELESLQRSHDTLVKGLLTASNTSESPGAPVEKTNESELEDLRTQLALLQRSHDALLHSLSATNDNPKPFQASPPRRTLTGLDVDAVLADLATISDDSTDDEDEFFIQDELHFHSFDHEHLREHLKTHNWTEHGKKILGPVIADATKLLKQPHLFHMGPGPAEDRSHYSHFQVYNVGPDGVLELREVTGLDNTMSKAAEIWHMLRNSGKQADEKVVGRITIAREPSPILFGALHLTHSSAFDMDELFQHLVETALSSAHMFRAFDQSPRRRKTFFFHFGYYTLIGDDCIPMRWQDRHDPPNHHVPLSRCSAVVALALNDENPRRLRNRSKRGTRYGWMTDVWSPWQVLQLESFPDWKSTPANGTAYTFETGHKYLNRAEAFLHALLTEYKDARKRYHGIHQSITELVTPPTRFLFNEELRKSRLFEDKDFTWISRYFFAHQTLILVNDSMKAMIDAFEDTFTDDVWEGRSKTLWPIFEDSPRDDRWKHRLRLLRLNFEREMREFRILMRENNEKSHEIDALREQLYSVTSIKESRKSVEQGNNIKVLTLVNLFFMLCQRCQIIIWRSCGLTGG